MKTIAIITINDNNNYGNRLQNYAVQEFCKKLDNNDIVTIKNNTALNNNKTIGCYVKEIVKNILRKIKRLLTKNIRIKYFEEFNKKIFFSKKKFNWLYLKWLKKYDFFITGSDQVWNPNFGRLSEVDLLTFVPDNKRIAFSASFGISKLPEECKEKTANELKKFKAISVREDDGKKIVEELTGRNDVEVLVDPTMLLSADEWDKVSKKPKQLKTNRYILNYFLGDLSESRKKEIERIAKENNCEIINILDKNSGFYETGPSEFLYLEKNAFLICTDSFHSCVFAIIYNRPFVIFDREDKNVSMNSRIETLINKLELENRKFEGKITEKILKHDYTNAYKILEKEKEKSYKFLSKALNLEEKIEGKKSN